MAPTNSRKTFFDLEDIDMDKLLLDDQYDEIIDNAEDEDLLIDGEENWIGGQSAIVDEDDDNDLLGRSARINADELEELVEECGQNKN